MHAAHILTLLLVCTIVGSQNPVQLSYYFYDGNLVLQCEVLNPYLSVFIVDFNDREQGHCRPIPVPKCFNYFKRETKLSFNNITNVTTFIKGASDMRKITGKWTCKHGSGEGNPSSTIYVTMIVEERAYNHVTTAMCLIYFAVFIGFVPPTKVLFCKVVRKIKGTYHLCDTINCMDWTLPKLVEMIPGCRQQSEKTKKNIVIGIQLLLCLLLVMFPYLTVRIIEHIYFRNTKDPPNGVYVFLMVEGSIIGMVCAIIVMTLVDTIQNNTTKERNTIQDNTTEERTCQLLTKDTIQDNTTEERSEAAAV